MGIVVCLEPFVTPNSQKNVVSLQWGENRKRIVFLFLCMLKNWKLWLNCSKSQRWRKTWESAIRDLSGLVCMCLRIYVCREQSKEATSLVSRWTVWLSTGKQKWGYERSHSHPFSKTRALDLTVINGCHCHAWWYRAHIKKVREGESALSPDEDASSLVSKCNVLSQVSHLLPIMSGIQAATRLHIAAKTPQTSMAGNVKPSIIYYPWRAECFKGDKQFFFSFFFSGIQQQQAVSWLMCCDWHSPCTAGGGDSHGWRPSVLLFKLSWDIGLLSRLRLHLTAHFHYPSTLFWFHMCPETSCASHRFNKRPDCEHWSEGMFCSTRLLKWDESIQKKTHCCCSAMVDEWTPHRWKPQNMSFGVVL